METVVITGASSGIGQALAEEHARRGSRLILVARRLPELEQTKSACLALKPELKIELLVADVARPDFIEVLKRSLAQVDDLKFVYVNAGVGSAGRFEKLDMQHFKRVFDINVFGALQTVYGSLDALKKSKGRIVLIGSMNSYFALPLGAAYNMSKFAVRALGETLSTEFVTSGIKVSTVYPGPVHTNILSTDNKGRANPEAKAYFANNPGLSAEEAARRLVKSAVNGKRAFSLAASSSFLIWFQQRFPSTVAFLTRVIYARFEKKFLEMVGKVNPDAV
jgi:short-subunit dehydrogenase